MTNDQLQSAIWHLFYKNHEFAPHLCSGCEMVQKALDEYSCHPMTNKWCRPEYQYESLRGD